MAFLLVPGCEADPMPPPPDAGVGDASVDLATGGPESVDIVTNCVVPDIPDGGIQLATDIHYATMDGQELRLDVAWPTTLGPPANANELAKVLRPIRDGEADVAIASREARGAIVRDRPLWRRAFSRLCNAVIRHPAAAGPRDSRHAARAEGLSRCRRRRALLRRHRRRLELRCRAPRAGAAARRSHRRGRHRLDRRSAVARASAA